MGKAYACGKCGGDGQAQATKQLSIKRLPNTLAIQLKVSDGEQGSGPGNEVRAHLLFRWPHSDSNKIRPTLAKSRRWSISPRCSI